ncbi:MAG TPA: Chromate resistance protein ChrB [Chloroflexia bacterium]|nr:Chromate resistance protein ChrB [Chloroflexia bacterium]
MREWILLHYKVPREPSASRVYVWRKLKRIGAVLLHDAIWVLPSNPRTMEQFQWLAAEIGELEGEAMLWESRLIQPGQEEKLVQQFMTQVEKDYLQILAELESGSQGEPELDLTALSKRYQQTRQQDYFHSDLGQQVREALLAASSSESQPKEVSRVEPGNELE